MTELKKGEFTGEIVKQFDIDNNIITNTLYSVKRNNPSWHYHENFHFCFVMQNGVSETKKTSRTTHKNGSIFAYRAGEIHRWITKDSLAKSINIEIDESYFINYNLNENQLKQSLDSNFESKNLILKIQKETLINDSSSRDSILMLLMQLSTLESKNYSKRKPRWVDTLYELLNDKWNCNTSLSSISDTLGIHPVTVSKNFQKYFSFTLGEYRRKLKIDNSLGLIQHSQLSLSEIALECGFSDQSHFIRTFREQTGFLPREFKNLITG